jgi:hypothetical protein
VGSMTHAELETLALSTGLYQGCRLVSEFIHSDVRPRVAKAIKAKEGQPSDPTITILGQIVRISEWLKSFAKLDSPEDYQAVSAGTRAILESAIDVALLTYDDSQWKAVHAWEESAQLGQAIAMDAYSRRQSTVVEGEHKARVHFIETRRKDIEADRLARGWCRRDKRKNREVPTHPGRWTNRNLQVDAQMADKLVPGKYSFEEIYETRYRELCYCTHGSGSAFRRLRNPNVFAFVGGRCYDECAKLALQAGEKFLKYLNGWDGDTITAFEAIEKRRVVVIGLARDKVMKAGGSTSGLWLPQDA